MLCSSGRVLIRRNLSLKRQFSCVLRQTHFESLRNSSLFPPSMSELPSRSSSSSSFSVYRRPAALGLVLSYLRSFRSMASESQNTKSVHDFIVKDAKGNAVDLSTYKGKVLLIVNVASKCTFTNSNYMELGELYNKYKNQDLEILAFPCNQFGSQEPGTNEQIVEFACSHFKAEYPIFDKVDVNGGNATPLYKFLKSGKGGLFGDSIKWNFTKFLVDKEGNVVGRYASTTSPLSIESDIKKLLGIA